MVSLYKRVPEPEFKLDYWIIRQEAELMKAMADQAIIDYKKAIGLDQ